MSWVANVMLSVSHGEDLALVDEFNTWLRDEAPWNGLSVPPGAKGVGTIRPIHLAREWWGGSKNPEVLLWAGVTNHADVSAVVERFGSIRWREAGSVQLFVMDQDDESFEVWMIREDQPVRLTLPDG